LAAPSCFVSRSLRGTNLRGFWDARIYAFPVGNPFARRHNFYRKVAAIRRQSGNEQGGLVPRTQRLRSGALQSRGSDWIASSQLLLAMTENTALRFLPVIASEAKQSIVRQTSMRKDWVDSSLRSSQ
jgi:hypothetical protein